MMRKQANEDRNQFAMLNLVPKNHLVRKIDAAILFNFNYPIVGSTYSNYDRPYIDLVVLIKLVFIQYLFGIRSMRQIMKVVETNAAYRCFLCYSFENSIHISLFLIKTMFEDLKNRLYLKRFSLILLEQAGFVTEEKLYIDSTHISKKRLCL